MVSVKEGSRVGEGLREDSQRVVNVWLRDMEGEDEGDIEESLLDACGSSILSSKSIRDGLSAVSARPRVVVMDIITLHCYSFAQLPAE